MEKSIFSLLIKYWPTVHNMIFPNTINVNNFLEQKSTSYNWILPNISQKTYDLNWSKQMHQIWFMLRQSDDSKYDKQKQKKRVVVQLNPLLKHKISQWEQHHNKLVPSLIMFKKIYYLHFMTDTLTKNTIESLRTKLGCSRINLKQFICWDILGRLFLQLWLWS